MYQGGGGRFYRKYSKKKNRFLVIPFYGNYVEMCPIIPDLRSEKQLIDIMFRFLCFYEEAILFFFDKISFYQREIIFLKSRNGDLHGPVNIFWSSLVRGTVSLKAQKDIWGGGVVTG